MGKKMLKRFTAWLITLAMVVALVPVPKVEANGGPAQNAILRIHGNPSYCDTGRVFFGDSQENTGYVVVWYTTTDTEKTQPYVVNSFTQHDMEDSTTGEKYFSADIPSNATEVEIRFFPYTGYNESCRMFTEYAQGSGKTNVNGADLQLAAENGYHSYKLYADDLSGLQKLVFAPEFSQNNVEGGDQPQPAEKGFFSFFCRENKGKAKISYELNDEPSTASGDVEVSTEQEYEPIDVSSYSNNAKLNITIDPYEGYEIDQVRGVSLRVDGNEKVKTAGDDLTLNDNGSFTKEYALKYDGFSENETPADHSYQLEFELKRVQTLIIGTETVIRGNKKVNDNEKYSGITVDPESGNICMEDCIFPEDKLYIYSRGSIEMKGDLSFNRMDLGENSAIEIWGRGKGSVETYDGFAHLYLNDGIVGEGDGAERICFRDALMLNIGQTLNEDKTVSHSNALAAFSEIKNVDLWNYEFHNRDPYTVDIAAVTAFENVDKVELTSAKVNLYARTMFDRRDEKKTDMLIFQEGVLDYYVENIGDGKLISKYYSSYPEGGFIADMDNAGDAGGEFVSNVEVDLTKTEDESNQYGYLVKNHSKNELDYTIIESTDPILYSVAYTIDEDIEFTNADKGTIEMSGFNKGYYTVDKKTGRFEAWIAEGETVNVKILPDQGYQYVKDTLNINGDIISTKAGDTDVVGQYTFTMPANAGHMSADFIKTEDVVKVSSDATKVKTADIEMNGNPIGFGNAKLIVDMAEPDDATKNAIASVVGTGEKTELSFEYVDLTLLQSVVKNYDKSKDMESQEAWDTQLTDLNSTVTIKLDLNDTLSAYDEGVSVVRVHDGKAETLDATVDGNSVAFSTDRFSTYAIVGKKKIMSEKKIKPAVVVDPTDPPASTVITDKDTQIEEKKDAKKEDTTNAKKKATSLKKGSKFSVTKNSVKINYIVTANLQVQVISVSNKKTVTIPATVKYDGFTYKVTSIGAEAFASKKKIAQVTIGSNIRRIGSAAFYNCKKLKKITFKGKYKKLTIGKYAFKGIHSGARIYIIKDVFAKYKKAIKNSVTSKIKYYKTK